MGSALSIKKQVRVALYTTPVIAALTMSPIAILQRYSIGTYAAAVSFTMTLVLFLWSINILLWYLGARSTARRTLLSVLVSFGLAFFVVVVLFSGHSSMSVSPQVNFHFHLILFFAVNVVVIIVQNLVISREKNAVMELENQALKLKNMEAVNQQLKQQIQPHFLFNSLSTLKSLMAADPESAEDYLIRLSDFLRASLSSHTLNTIPLGDELRLTINYLEMQKIRCGNALRFIIRVPEEVWTSYSLPAFSLQMLAENAIKHNILTLYRPLIITVTWQDGVITVSNNLQKKETDTQGTGVGLVNLQERYRILSGNNIIIEEKEDTFSVSIKALEYASSDH
ncbi:MAG: histidine kinase [Chitinophagaceae bacterium]|nr:histidine kinase [Chitinophagaceae bacterium]